jgi:hypothetical protein
MPFRLFILFLWVLLSFFNSNTIYAQAKKKSFLILNLKFKEKESFAMMIRKFTKLNSIIRKTNPMIQETFKANPHIHNWKKISGGTKIKLYITKEYIDADKLNAYLSKFKNTKIEILQDKKQNELHWNISSQFGLVNITSEDDDTLSMNFKKVGIKYNHKLINDYRYFLNLSTVQFSNIDSSRATGKIDKVIFLPEFGLGVSKRMSNKFSTSIAYDFLNYFFIKSTNSGFSKISTDNIHRVSIRPYYELFQNLGVLSSFGYIAGPASGLDFTLGLNYSFGKKKNYSFTIMAYIGQLDINTSKESSNAFIASLGYGF